VPIRPIRKDEVELLERMAREPLGRAPVDEAILESLEKRGLVEQKRDTWSITTRGKTLLMRRKQMTRSKRKRTPTRDDGSMGS
jgi:ribosomal protein S19E (S16A)